MSSPTEVREGQLTPRRVIVSEARGQRPSDWVRRDEERTDQACPFCPGHEADTPREIWALRSEEAAAPDTPGWQVRVVPNKYPIAEPHELILETPHHDADLPDLTEDEVERIVHAYRERVRAMAEAEPGVYPALFKNVGRAAGASRAHLHAQLLGLPFLPPRVEAELALAHDHRRRTEGCLYCDTIAAELTGGERIISAEERFLVWAPKAAIAPYECWILPRAHAPSFRAMEGDDVAALASVLRRTIRGLQAIFAGRFAYNAFLHTAPLRTDAETPGVDGFHWHIEILPRLGTPAGLEWGSGVFVNAVAPERAAAQLRPLVADGRAPYNSV